ncbi:MAG: HAD family phosphatase [Desulfobacterales bacterium]|nr:HAD family phosphatase [Desulfobacterales bacterium]
MSIVQIKAVLFDFGGVLADEGFRAGLAYIAEQNGLDIKTVQDEGFKLVFEQGFVTGKIRESTFWNIFREHLDIQETDQELTEIVLSRFTLRPWMLDIVSTLHDKGFVTAILSDQTHWLDEINERYNFFKFFDFVFNSYYLGISKKNPAIFKRVLKKMNIRQESAVFIDDHPGNIERAGEQGLHGILYEEKNTFLKDIQHYCPDLKPGFPGLKR